jgi:oxaloacetate decarboxylase gamma subunit
MAAGLFEQGLEIMVFGMGTVIAFLTLLVFATRLMSLLVMRFSAPLPASLPKVGQPPSAVTGASQQSPETVAAITAAIHQYRNRPRR